MFVRSSQASVFKTVVFPSEKKDTSSECVLEIVQMCDECVLVIVCVERV